MVCIATAADIHSHGRVAHSDPGGAGGIPYSGLPGPANGITVKTLATFGVVLDSSEVGVPGTPVIVLGEGGSVVAACVTSATGEFVLQLPDISGLAASVPLNGVFDVPVQAGSPLVIFVP
jgi:hypothetical protein